MPAVLPAVPSRFRAPAARHGRTPLRAGDVLLREAPGWQTGAVVPSHPIDRLRPVCLALPEAEEKETWGDPTFRVRGKIFAMAQRGDGRVSLWCKAPPGAQATLVGADPRRFFVPPYVGSKGWVGVRLDDAPDWDEVAALVERSYRLVAPKRLAASVA
jgi:predicted DNA-binding protein (MmcQ/YjbR family)